MTEPLADPDQKIRPWQRDIPCSVPLRDGIEIKTRFRNVLLGIESVTV